MNSGTNANLAAMALDTEFKRHLHSLMVEVSENTSDARVQYKNDLVGKARATNNTAAIPIAYKNAKLHDIEIRVGKTIEKYIEAVDIWGFSIDAAFEKDLINEFLMLTAGPNQLHFPPMMKWHDVQAVQGSFARERAQLANRLVREGTNRLRELKMKKRQANNRAIHTTNVSFNGPVGNAYVDSTVIQTNNSFAITEGVLHAIDQISEGHGDLQTAALELRTAQRQGVGILDKFQKWAVLMNTVMGLADKVHQYYPHIESLISQFGR